MEALSGNPDEEDALENGDVHSNPVRVLDALTENNETDQSVVCSVCNSTDSRQVSLIIFSDSSPGMECIWSAECWCCVC